jgi:hypothetical protein
MQKTENMAGGMSYRIMNGIDTSKIMSYLEGRNKNHLQRYSTKIEIIILQVLIKQLLD